MTRRLFIEPPVQMPDFSSAAQPAALLPELSAWLTAEDHDAASELWPDSRRREFLTWRAIVRRFLGRDISIGYNSIGAPVILCDATAPTPYISVTHCSGRVTVLISDRPCAVDIEPQTRDFSRAARRYMTPEEEALPTSAAALPQALSATAVPTPVPAPTAVPPHTLPPPAAALWPAIVWCAKEALYKYSGRTGLDFRRDLRIVEAVPATCETTCETTPTHPDLPGTAPAAPTQATLLLRLTGSICGGEPVLIDVMCRDGCIIACI